MSKEFFDMLKKSKTVIALDFDGVIHNDNLGYHDGSIYGDPIEGSKPALEHLSKSYTLVIYSCKSNPTRPLVDGKTGTELIWEWLEKWEMKQYISDVVWGKPNACVYIDDKGIGFKNWSQTLYDFVRL